VNAASEEVSTAELVSTAYVICMRYFGIRSIEVGSRDDEDDGAKADMNNLDTTIQVSPIPTTIIHKDYPLEQVIGDLQSATQTRQMSKKLEEEPKKVIHALKDPSWIEAIQEELLQFKLQKVWTLVDLPNGKMGFEDPDFPDRVYKVEKALYGLHQAPRDWYETLSTYLLDNGFQRGKIDKTLFIKRHKGDILLVQVYVDDIIFGSTKKELFNAFENQNKYVVEILKKFGFTEVKTASTPMETQKPLLKDENGEEVDAHMYRLMIGSLMYLTSSRPDIMFVVYACARYQVNPKASHLHTVKRIFRLISQQCKKQTVVENSTTEVEYVAASSCCRQKQRSGRSKRKYTEVPQPSGPTTNVADEAVYEEMDDSLKRAATTATSLDAEQDRGNINKTQSKATLNEPSSLGTNSGSGLRRQDTMGDTIARTKFENVSKISNDSLLAGGRIADIDADAGINLVSTHFDADTNMFRVNDLEGDEVVVETEVASKDVNLSVDEVTLAQTLVALKSAKPKADKVMLQEPEQGTITTTTAATTITAVSTRPKAKGLVIHEQEQAPTPTVSSQQPSQVKIQDKGKGKMVEPEPVKKLSKKYQLVLDEELAFKLQAEEEEEERLARKKAQQIEEVNIAWDDVHVTTGNFRNFK
ncbi:putative ribonuclease H-like domain-containing protein, partial [Tanacetum coccineum]